MSFKDIKTVYSCKTVEFILFYVHGFVNTVFSICYSLKATNMAYIPESGSEGDNSKQMDGETLVYNESDDEDKELKQKMSVVATQAFMRDDSGKFL